MDSDSTLATIRRLNYHAFFHYDEPICMITALSPELGTAAALALFALVSSVTPGPNNLMLLSSGTRFGLRRTVPHMLGVSLGHAFLVFCIGCGLYQLFSRIPHAELMLKIAGISYLVYLAYKIATAPVTPLDVDENHTPVDGVDHPLTFMQAALFQWINPKGVMMAITVIATYFPGFFPGLTSLSRVVLLALLFCLINLPSVAIWAVAGAKLRRFLVQPLYLRRFNQIMAALLVISILPLFRT